MYTGNSDTEVQVRVGTLKGEIFKCQIPLGLPMGEPWGFTLTGVLNSQTLKVLSFANHSVQKLSLYEKLTNAYLQF